jgi:ankyrin repeat protein
MQHKRIHLRVRGDPQEPTHASLRHADHDTGPSMLVMTVGGLRSFTRLNMSAQHCSKISCTPTMLRDKFGRTALSHACERNSYRALDLLLEVGAECMSKDHAGMTPLHHAAKSGNFAVAKRLVGHTKNGNPALELAGHMRQSTVEEKLISIGRDIANWTEDNLRNLLIQSAHDGRDVIVRRILHIHKVDDNVRDSDGRTPLSHAAEMGHRNILRILLRCGADHLMKDNHGQLPEDYALDNGNLACQRLLENW